MILNKKNIIYLNKNKKMKEKNKKKLKNNKKWNIEINYQYF